MEATKAKEQTGATAWDENTAEQNYNAGERGLTDFINRRIKAANFLTLPVSGRDMHVVRYFFGTEGAPLGRLKVAEPNTEITHTVVIDETILDTLLTKLSGA